MHTHKNQTVVQKLSFLLKHSVAWVFTLKKKEDHDILLGVGCFKCQFEKMGNYSLPVCQRIMEKVYLLYTCLYTCFELWSQVCRVCNVFWSKETKKPQSKVHGIMIKLFYSIALVILSYVRALTTGWLVFWGWLVTTPGYFIYALQLQAHVIH